MLIAGKMVDHVARWATVMDSRSLLNAQVIIAEGLARHWAAAEEIKNLTYRAEFQELFGEDVERANAALALIDSQLVAA